MATSPSPTCTKTKKGDEPCDDHDESNGGEGFDHLLLQKLDLGPRKKLLVLDLNGLLIRRAHRCDKLQMQSNRQPDIEIGYRLVFKRPFCEEFIQFCLERFEVGIWSTAQEHNTDGVFNCAFKGLKSKLLFVWDQRQCSDYGFMSLENKEKPLFFKELKKVWEKVGSSMGKRGSYSAVDTLLIDNSPYRGFLNPPNTGIYPDPYDPSCLTDNALDPSKELGQYLNGLVDADHVQTYVKDHPFGQPAIGPDHPDWRFYSKIRHSLGFDKPSTREVDTI